MTIGSIRQLGLRGIKESVGMKASTSKCFQSINVIFSNIEEINDYCDGE